MKTRHLGEFESHVGCAAISRCVTQARETGQAALAALDLHERAQLLRRLGKDLLKAPGPVLANLGCDSLRFHAPVYFGPALHVEMTCNQIISRPRSDFGAVRCIRRVLDEKGKLAAQYVLLTLVRKQWPEPAPAGC